MKLLLAAMSALSFVASAGGPDSLVVQARLLKERGDFVQAARLFEKALMRDPGNPQIEGELGAVCDQLGKLEEAARAYSTALKSDPGNYWFHIRLAQDDVRLGRWDQARAEFALEKSDPHGVDQAYIAEGYADFENSDHYERAVKEIEAAVRDHPDDPLVYRHLGNLLSRTEHWAQAEDAYRKSLSLLESAGQSNGREAAEAAVNLGNVMMAQGKIPQARMTLLSAIRRLPEDSRDESIIDILIPLHMTLGQAYGAENRPADEEAELEQARELCPRSILCSKTPRFLHLKTEPLVFLGLFYADHGRMRKARRAADQAWRLYSAAGIDPMLAFNHNLDVLDELAGLLLKLTDRRRALKVYDLVRLAHAKMPADPTAARVDDHLSQILGQQPMAADQPAAGAVRP